MSQILKNEIRAILVAQRTIAQEYLAFDKVIDFIVQSSTTGIPAWTNALTFNNNGTGSGAFCTYPDVNGALRFWNSKTNGNIGNAPPTAVDVTFNTFWQEVSPAVGSAIKEWAPGIFGSGLVIVYYDISGSGADPELYLLTVGARPFNSSNFATELAANQWKKLAGITSTDITTALGFTPENAANKGAANGYASLDSGGKVPSGQLPSYVDDVLEYANLAAFPVTGESGKIYIAIDTNLSYRWSGSVYVQVTSVPSDASETVKGIAEIATQAETNTGTDDLRFVTPKKLKDQNFLAPLASPALTGTPTAPTAAAGTNTTQLATTAFVKAEIDIVKNLQNIGGMGLSM